jgi:hypothetical protein
MFFPERHLQKTACFTSQAGKKLMLDDGAHLGRQDSLQRTRENLPRVFERAHKAVNLGMDNRISRNHALLLKEDGCWTIYDLNSRSGTHVNWIRIKAGEGVALKKGGLPNIGTVKGVTPNRPKLVVMIAVGKGKKK